MRRFIKKFKNSIIGKILKVLFKILLWIAEVIIIFLAAIIVTQRVTNDQKTFMGFRIYNVATGSMEPEYAVGDILISREKEPREIKVGDNIVYLGKSGGYEGKIITHSVIEIEQKENGEYLFHTKGKANTIEDPVVSEEQVYGVVFQNNVVLAWICRILTNRYGLYFFVVIPIILYAFMEFVKVQGQKVEEEREQRRLEEERKKQNKKRKLKEIEEVEEVDQEEEISEEVATPKRTKSKTTATKKKEKEEVSEEKTEETKKTKSKGASTKKKEKEEVSEEKTEETKKTKSKGASTKKKEEVAVAEETSKVKKASKTSKKQEDVTAKKTTKKKQAKEE